MTVTYESYVMPITWHELIRGLDEPRFQVSRLVHHGLPSEHCVRLTPLHRSKVSVVRYWLQGVNHRLFGCYVYERHQFRTVVWFRHALVYFPERVNRMTFAKWFACVGEDVPTELKFIVSANSIGSGNAHSTTLH